MTSPYVSAPPLLTVSDDLYDLVSDHATDRCLPPEVLPLGVIEEITPSSACDRILRDIIAA